MQNKEREIQSYGGAFNHPSNEAFSGDMNAIIKNNHQPAIINSNPLEKKNFDLFNENFVSNYHNAQQKNNENLNIINSIFGNAGHAP